MTEKVETAAAVRARVADWRKAGLGVGLVPTMGALHEGHLALVKAAQKQGLRVVVSVFVNPLQFGPNEDYEKYARQIEKDLALLDAQGCDLLFAPTVAEMYPDGFVTKIDPGPLGTILEGASRPGHFAGVATVVAKLFLLVGPDAAFFGEKDYQQLLVIRRFVRDLNFPLTIVPVPIVRETDGLARSSRNAYLSETQRCQAPSLHKTLTTVCAALSAGTPLAEALAQGRLSLAQAGFEVDYLEAREAETLAPLEEGAHKGRLLVAAKIGTTRLIDNVPLSL